MMVHCILLLLRTVPPELHHSLNVAGCVVIFIWNEYLYAIHCTCTRIYSRKGLNFLMKLLTMSPVAT
jgi:hypothetical protein